MSLLRRLGFVVGAILLCLGVWFLVAPDDALTATHHSRDILPLVMGGRYGFFGVILIAALLYQDNRVIAFLLLAFAGVAFFDTALYWQLSPLPHFAVGVASLMASLAYYIHRDPKA